MKFYEGLCGWCNAPFKSKQPTTQYCSRQHKKNAASKRHRERNPGYYKQYSQAPSRIAYREDNRDKLRIAAREHMRRRREQDPDSMRKYNREWFRANSGRHVEYNRRRRALKLSGTLAELLDIEWERIKSRQRGICYYCGQMNGVLSQDHVIPLSRSGLHTPGNIVGACVPCNSSKCDAFIVEWKRRGGVVKGY